MSHEPLNPTNPGNSSGFDEGTMDDKEPSARLTSQLKERVTEITAAVSESVDRQRENVAGGLDRGASTIHERAGSLPGGQKAANAANGIADRMESTASYLRDHDFREIGASLTCTLRQYPVPSLLSALAIGFLVGRTLRK